MRKAVIGFTLSTLLFALCFLAEAQQSTKVFRIGYLSALEPATESARAEAIRVALRELGYIEGQNIVTEYRYAEGKNLWLALRQTVSGAEPLEGELCRRI